MSCTHVNPAGYLFCGSCGEALDPVRCRCGFVVGTGDIFCGRCGVSLSVLAAGNGPVAAERRFDLERLAQQAAQENQFLETSDKIRVTQDDIRKLLTKRKKKFH